MKVIKKELRVLRLSASPLYAGIIRICPGTALLKAVIPHAGQDNALVPGNVFCLELASRSETVA